MINISFTKEEIEVLNYERYHHPHPRVQKKMEALYLKSLELNHCQIAKCVGISDTTLWNYFQEYQKDGIDGLKKINFYKPESELNQYRTTIEAYFRANPVSSINEAIDIIAKITGIRRSPTQVRAFFKKIGIKRRKVGIVPGKANTAEQKEFLNEKLQPKLEEAKVGKRALFFVDASHFVMGAFIGFLWCFLRVFIKTPSGRQRFNVLAAFNAITHEIITVCNDTYINAESVCQLLYKISNLNLNIPITLVLDNARYQHCKLVQSLADSLNIELLFLPPYSPNLNLIERLWKFVKKQCLYSKYYENFNSFKDAIYTCITTAHLKHKKDLESLLTLNFQTFESFSL